MKTKLKKFFKWLIIFMILGVFITAIALRILDDLIYKVNNSSDIKSSGPQAVFSSTTITTSDSIEITDNMNSIQFSYNNKYYTYLEDGNIKIASLDEKEVIDTVDEDLNITYYNLLYDKNLILYFTEKKTGSTTKLQLNTYDISSKRVIEYTSINVTNFSKIKELEASPIINMIYLNIETQSGIYTSDIAYKIDLFNNVSRITSGKTINNLVSLKHTDRLYYTTTSGDLYYQNYKQSLFKTDVEIIGTDLDDNIYFINTEDKSIIYKVYKNKIVDTMTMTDSDIVSWYSDNTSVYLVYPTYILDITSENPYERIAKLSDYVSFVTIKDDTAYLKTQDNVIVWTKIK